MTETLALIKRLHLRKLCILDEIDELTKTTDLLYTTEVKNTIQLLINIIRQIVVRNNVLVSVVEHFSSSITKYV